MTDSPAVLARNGITFTLIPLESCLGHARKLLAAGRPWHSHVLSPGCAHNPDPNRYAIVIEDEQAGVAYLAPSDRFPEVDKHLVRLLHGDDILDAAVADADPSRARHNSRLLDGLAPLQASKTPWHHHMHFPACVLNPHPGRWCIAVESPEGTFSETFADEPVTVLRQVEVLYFGNLDAEQRRDD